MLIGDTNYEYQTEHDTDHYLNMLKYLVSGLILKLVLKVHIEFWFHNNNRKIELESSNILTSMPNSNEQNAPPLWSIWLHKMGKVLR